jgi:hypothetical protein
MNTNPLSGWLGMASKTAKTAPLTPDSSKMLITMLMGDSTPERLEKLHLDMMTVFPYAVMYKRLESFRPVACKNIDKRVLVLVSALCTSPGQAVLWAYTLAALAASKLYTLEDWCETFPVGTPTEEAISKLWDHQKGFKHGIEADNLLDNPDYWPEVANG